MSNKFKFGDEVRFMKKVGIVLGIQNCWNGNIISYLVLSGNQILSVAENDLEKIEETKPNIYNEELYPLDRGEFLKYKVGDSVYFRCCNTHPFETGTIEKIDNEVDKNHVYTLLCDNGYFKLHDKDIISKSEITHDKKSVQMEFKKGDEVWVKAKITPWDGCIKFGEIQDGKGYVAVKVCGRYNPTTWANEHDVKKVEIIAPKNDGRTI